MICCYCDCFYEGDDSECLVKDFIKPKDGECGGKMRCISCDHALSEKEFKNGEDICPDCIRLLGENIEN